jgi:hypothetical protein
VHQQILRLLEQAGLLVDIVGGLRGADQISHRAADIVPRSPHGRASSNRDD